LFLKYVFAARKYGRGKPVKLFITPELKYSKLPLLKSSGVFLNHYGGDK